MSQPGPSSGSPQQRSEVLLGSEAERRAPVPPEGHLATSAKAKATTTTIDLVIEDRRRCYRELGPEGLRGS